MQKFEDACYAEYRNFFKIEFEKSTISDPDEKRRYSQKKAIKDSTVALIEKFPHIDPAQIWKTVYVAHVHNVSGIDDQLIIDSIISADNSWKKSSGHAFEEMIKDIGNIYLSAHNIVILLQKELSSELKKKKIANEPQDLKWLHEQCASSVFDLFLAIIKDDKYIVYGCIQSKTSIRDRVTRDREPSIKAMDAFFFSIAIVMDGEFLKLSKFIGMVNGGTSDYKLNGWHAMYVLSFNSNGDNDRIKHIDISFSKLISDSVQAAAYWSTQRQWMNGEWRPTENSDLTAFLSASE
jgi:hypothetical protein